MIFLTFEYLFTNFGKKPLSPIMSSVTSICPSQYLDAPIPIVGTEMLYVIFLAKLSTTHSITTANTPDFEMATASSKIFFFLNKISTLKSKISRILW